MNELIKVDYQNENPTVSAHDLHEFLQVGTKFQDWFPRMCEYGFSEGADFSPLILENVSSQKRERTYSSTDYRLSLPMAKEISMLQRNEQGKQARQYFLKIEEAWNRPEMVMARALKLADKTVADMQNRVKVLTPKAETYDALADRSALTNFRDTAKELGTKQNQFISFLTDHNYIYHSDDGIRPHARYDMAGVGYFDVVETYNKRTKWSGIQTMITFKGREHFSQLLRRRMLQEAAQ